MKTIEVQGSTFRGLLEATPVKITATRLVSTGHAPLVAIDGIPLLSLKETRVRVRSALDQIGFTPDFDVRVCVEPVSATASGLDLAIAVAIERLRHEEAPARSLEGWVFIGELSLSAQLRSVRGTLTHVLNAKWAGAKGVIVPCANQAEVMGVEGIEVLCAQSLREVVDFFSKGTNLYTPARSGSNAYADEGPLSFSDIKANALAKRALSIAAVGGHSILFVGAPGSGKTILARSLAGLLPALNDSQAQAVTEIYSIAGLLRPGIDRIRTRPFRAPHHTVSKVGVMGGGTPFRPGEISLAQYGVLFLDEVTEFAADVLHGVAFPQQTVVGTNFQLVGATNACPCGWSPDSRRCACSPERIARYLSRVPDLFDIVVKLAPLTIEECREETTPGEGERARDAVAQARKRGRSSVVGPLPFDNVRSRLLPIAISIATLDGSTEVTSAHTEEAKTLVREPLSR